MATCPRGIAFPPCPRISCQRKDLTLTILSSFLVLPFLPCDMVPGAPACNTIACIMLTPVLHLVQCLQSKSMQCCATALALATRPPQAKKSESGLPMRLLTTRRVAPFRHCQHPRPRPLELLQRSKYLFRHTTKYPTQCLADRILERRNQQLSNSKMRSWSPPPPPTLKPSDGRGRVISSKFGTYTPGLSNFMLRVPGGVVRAGASAKAAQSTPLWATLSAGPKKAPHACYYRAWGRCPKLLKCGLPIGRGGEKII
jgi:hypothetical protein